MRNYKKPVFERVHAVVPNYTGAPFSEEKGQWPLGVDHAVSVLAM